MIDSFAIRQGWYVGWVAGLLGLISTSTLEGADQPPSAGLRLFAEGFTAPTAFVPLKDGSGRILVADQVGTVHLLSREGGAAERPVLDLRSRMVKLNEGFDERGLIGLAVHPRFEENRKLYVHYSAPARLAAPREWDHTSHLSEFRLAADDPWRVDPASERVLMEIDQPYFNHNGGCLVFGPDGYLYISVGDGGNANDVGRRGPLGNGQDTMTVLGKILRIDVDQGAPYAIPPGNPFPDGAQGRPEIFAWGLRNAWQISFDRGGNRELFAADVGQNRFEEVNIIVQAGNYGWNIREAFHCFDPNQPNRSPEDCPKVGARGEPLLDPIVAYKNINGFRNDPEALGISVTGGFVYRGDTLPHLQGRYIFGDWSRQWARAEGVVLVATRPADGTGKWTIGPLPLASHPEGHLGEFLLAFGEDSAAELYVLTNGGNSPLGRTGRIYQLVPMQP